jgi:hypothetical protein
MNERIKLLAAQASDDGDHIHYYNPAFAEKFAELIVRECVEVCLDRHDTWRWGDGRSDSGPRDCAQSIKKHFGSEE